jgi:transmembrane sensor
MALFVASGFLAYDRLEGRIATERGEVRRVALEDGSTVSINGNSVLQVRFDEMRRHVVLRRGEASFQVAHNSERPFVVTADDVTVTAVGTEFAVGLTGKDVAVTVAEGVVKLQRGSASGEQQEQYLRHNEQFVAASTGPRRARLDPGEVNRRLAWRDGLLVFEGQPLGVAAEEVNRHSGKPVVIDDPTLARAEFIGVFHIGDAQSFANAAAYAFNGKVVERDDAYHLMRKQNSPSH